MAETAEQAMAEATAQSKLKSNLDLVNEADSFPYYHPDPSAYLSHTSSYYTLRLSTSPTPLGYLLPAVAALFPNIPGWTLSPADRSLTLHGSNATERSAIVARTAAAMRQTGHFKVLDKWRGELYAVYGDEGERVFDVERSASPLFGVVTYGVHMTAFVRVRRKAAAGGERTEGGEEKGEEELKIWVPRRAKTKQTYGGMLDNAVAGGISTGETPWESVVREAAEEASLPEEIVRERAKPCGTVTYFYVRDERAGGETGLLQPECQYVYDMELPENVVCRPCDGEVEEFYLWGVEEVKQAMARGEFKPNCALVMLDFFVRHGVINAANERDYVEIVSRLHRKLEFPTL